MRIGHFYKKYYEQINLKALVVNALYMFLLLYVGDYLFALYNKNYEFVKPSFGLFLVVFAVSFFEKFKTRVVLLGIILLTMLIEFLYFQYFGTYIQPIAFYQFFFNTKETFDVLVSEIYHMIIPIFIVFGLFVAIVILERYSKEKLSRDSRTGIVILVLYFLFSIYMIYIKLHPISGKLCHSDAKKIMPIPTVHSSVNYARALRYFLVGILPKKILSNDVKMFSSLPKPISKQELEENNIVFIIGESLRAKQLHILGYKEQTTPMLEKLSGLFAKSVYSSGTMTKVSVSSLLNRVKYPGSTAQIIEQKNNLYKLAKEHGYKTYFYSWQKKSQLKIIRNFMGKKYIDDYASREIIKKRVKHHDEYDDNLLKMLKKVDLNTYKNFIVLHERGSHATYSKQYPKEFAKYKNTYDNTVLYTDNVLSQIIDYIKKHSHKPTYFIFTSDHGELLHEHGRNGHGWFFKEVYKVPFIFWTNNKKYKLPQDSIQTHFDVSNLVVGLLGYNVDIEKEKIIYVNGSDVDALAGYLEIQVDDSGKELSVKKVR